VELDDGLRRIAGQALVRDDLLACVIALGGARPEQESAMEGCNNTSFSSETQQIPYIITISKKKENRQTYV
jgi:hypothetical protein